MGKRLKNKIKALSIIPFFVLSTVTCSSSKCRRKENIPPFSAVTEEAVTEDLKITTPHDKDKGRTVFIYKHDGSLQCGMGKIIPLDVMARELKGIKIISKENRHDGMMHIQACGTITGQANIYEIPEKDLSKAMRKGFKLWEFN